MATQYLVGPTRTYTTIQAAISAIPLDRTGTGIHEVIIDAGTYNFSSSISISGTTTSVDYIHVKAASGSEHGGLFTAGVIINLTVANYAFDLIPAYTRFSNLVITGPINASGGYRMAGTNCLFVNCLVRVSSNGHCFQTSNLGGATYICCLAVATSGGSANFESQSGNNFYYNCGSYNTSVSPYDDHGTGSIFKNCWGYRGSGLVFGVNALATQSNNASSDTSVSGSGSITNQTLAQLSFRDYLNSNFHINNISSLKGIGADLSAQFTIDFDSEFISTWSIGPDAQHTVGQNYYYVGTNKPYTTIVSAVAAIPSTLSGTGIHNVVVDAGDYASKLSISKTGSSSTDYIHIYAATGSEHNGDFTAGVRVRYASFQDTCVNVDTRYTKLTNIVSLWNSFDFGGFCYIANQPFCIFTNCLARNSQHTMGGGLISSGFRIQDPDNTFINCLSYPIVQTGVQSSGFQNTAGEKRTKYYNCGSYNNDIGWNEGSNAESVIINCWSIGGYRPFNIDNTGTISKIYCTHSDSIPIDTALAGYGAVFVTEADCRFVNSSSANFHINGNSLLRGVGDNLSTIFTTDWDNDTITTWCIGPDFIYVAPTQHTSSLPWVNNLEKHEEVEQAKDPGIVSLKPSESPDFNDNSRQNKVGKTTVPKTQSPQASPGRNNKGGSPRDAKAPTRKFDKSGSTSPGINKGNGYKDGFISVIPELGGVGAGTLGTGQKMAFFNDDLEIRKRYVDYESVTSSRQFKGHHDLGERPQGGFSYTLKTNDSIPLFMSHFQNRHGSNLGGGTTYYEFTPAFPSPTLVGSSFGTGTYGYARKNAFTVSVYKAIHGTGYHFKSGLCDSLNFFFLPIGVAEVKADFKFGTASLVGTSQMGSVGTYSRLPALPLSDANIYFAGLPLTSMQINSKNHLKESNVVGTEGNLYRFGNYEVTGRVTVDMPKDSLAYIGSMLSNQSFSVYGTLSNSGRDKLVFQMPTCKLEYFDATIDKDTMEIPFRAYTSEDGLTPPLKLMLWTQNYSATSFQPN